jgi:hypothetical protein
MPSESLGLTQYIPLFSLIISGLFALALLALIGLAIAALLKYLRTPPGPRGG